MNHCGTCTLCCKLLGVAEIKKPLDQWCSHCTLGGGCQIYETRPQSCVEFSCLWLQSQEHPIPFPAHLRPDKSKVVLAVTLDGAGVCAYVDPKTPAAWRTAPVQRLFNSLTDKGVRVVLRAGEKHFVFETGRARQIEMTPMNENGEQFFVRYIDQ